MNEEELKKPKLIWEGTLAEAIKLGKITQEDVDRWNREDEEGESFNEGYEEGFQKGKLEQKKEELTLLEDLLVKYNSRWLRIRIKEEIKQLQKEIKVSGDSLTEFWDNPEDDRWDKEYNPDLLPETLKNKEEKQDE